MNFKLPNQPNSQIIFDKKSSPKDSIKRTLGPILRVATLLAKNPSAYSFVENAHIDKRKKYHLNT